MKTIVIALCFCQIGCVSNITKKPFSASTNEPNSKESREALIETPKKMAKIDSNPKKIAFNHQLLQPFSFKNCFEIKENEVGKNNWILTRIKEVREDCLGANCPNIQLISYEFLPMKKGSKSTKILNESDVFHTGPTRLLRLDCQNGVIYFGSQSLDGEDGGAVYLFMFDLITGRKYDNPGSNYKGSYRVFLDGGNYMAEVESRDADENTTQTIRDGINHNPLPVLIRIYDCKDRIADQVDCSVKLERKIEISHTSQFSPTGVEGTVDAVNPVGGSGFSVVNYQSIVLTCQYINELTCVPSPDYSMKTIQ